MNEQSCDYHNWQNVFWILVEVECQNKLSPTQRENKICERIRKAGKIPESEEL